MILKKYSNRKFCKNYESHSYRNSLKKLQWPQKRGFVVWGLWDEYSWVSQILAFFGRLGRWRQMIFAVSPCPLDISECCHCSVVLDWFMVSSCIFLVVVHLPKFGSQCEELRENHKNQKWRFRNPGLFNARKWNHIRERKFELRVEKLLVWKSFKRHSRKWPWDWGGPTKRTPKGHMGKPSMLIGEKLRGNRNRGNSCLRGSEVSDWVSVWQSPSENAIFPFSSQSCGPCLPLIALPLELPTS